MAAHQAPPSLGFSRQEHWSGLPFPSPMLESKKWNWSHSVMPYRPHGLQPNRLLHPWDFPGKSTGVGCHALGAPEYFLYLIFRIMLWEVLSSPLLMEKQTQKLCYCPTSNSHKNVKYLITEPSFSFLKFSPISITSCHLRIISFLMLFHRDY